LPKKTKLDALKGNVEAQEQRLQEAFNTFEAAKSQASIENVAYENAASQESESPQSSSWDMLEKIISLEGDLLSSYREYTKELEKRVRKEEKSKPATEIPSPPESEEPAQAQIG